MVKVYILRKFFRHFVYWPLNPTCSYVSLLFWNYFVYIMCSCESVLLLSKSFFICVCFDQWCQMWNYLLFCFNSFYSLLNVCGIVLFTHSVYSLLKWNGTMDYFDVCQIYKKKNVKNCLILQEHVLLLLYGGIHSFIWLIFV